KLPVELSFKIDKELGYAAGTMLMMQTYFEIEDYRKRQHPAEGGFALGKLRKGLFWDTDISKIDSDIHATAIIRRVFERGNMEEKEYITDYYGGKRVAEVLGTDLLITR